MDTATTKNVGFNAVCGRNFNYKVLKRKPEKKISRFSCDDGLNGLYKTPIGRYTTQHHNFNQKYLWVKMKEKMYLLVFYLLSINSFIYDQSFPECLTIVRDFVTVGLHMYCSFESNIYNMITVCYTTVGLYMYSSFESNLYNMLTICYSRTVQYVLQFFYKIYTFWVCFQCCTFTNQSKI